MGILNEVLKKKNSVKYSVLKEPSCITLGRIVAQWVSTQSSGDGAVASSSICKICSAARTAMPVKLHV